eukprot:5057893-Prymnesium_polylepis.2
MSFFSEMACQGATPRQRQPPFVEASVRPRSCITPTSVPPVTNLQTDEATAHHRGGRKGERGSTERASRRAQTIHCAGPARRDCELLDRLLQLGRGLPECRGAARDVDQETALFRHLPLKPAQAPRRVNDHCGPERGNGGSVRDGLWGLCGVLEKPNDTLHIVIHVELLHAGQECEAATACDARKHGLVTKRLILALATAEHSSEGLRHADIVLDEGLLVHDPVQRDACRRTIAGLGEDRRVIAGQGDVVLSDRSEPRSHGLRALRQHQDMISHAKVVRPVDQLGLGRHRRRLHRPDPEVPM